MPPTCHLSTCHLLATDLPPARHRLATHAHGLPTHWHPQHALRSGNPHFGLISFDNVPVAFLLIFQAITLEGWTDIMSYLMNGVSPFFGGVSYTCSKCATVCIESRMLSLRTSTASVHTGV